MDGPGDLIELVWKRPAWWSRATLSEEAGEARPRWTQLEWLHSG
jgi:hypothetical protein